jgi:hypothetical protein
MADGDSPSAAPPAVDRLACFASCDVLAPTSGPASCMSRVKAGRSVDWTAKESFGNNRILTWPRA